MVDRIIAMRKHLKPATTTDKSSLTELIVDT